MPGPTPRQVKRAGQRHALRMASKSRPCHLGMTWFHRCLYVPASLLGLRFYILLLDLLRNLLLGLTWCTVFASMIACPLYSAFWAASILPWWLSIALVSFGLDYAVAGLFYTRFTVAHGQYYARVAVAYGLYFLVVSALRALVFAAPAFDFILQPLTGLRCVYHLVVIHGATILSLLNTCLRRCWIGLALRAPLLMPRAAALRPRRTKLSWMCETDLKVDALIAARRAAAAARADAAAAAFSDADFDIDRPVRGLPVQRLSMASLLSDISVLAQPFTVSLDRVPSFVPTLCPIGEERAPRADVRSCIAARVIQSAWRERERMINRTAARPVRARRVMSDMLAFFRQVITLTPMSSACCLLAHVLSCSTDALAAVLTFIIGAVRTQSWRATETAYRHSPRFRRAATFCCEMVTVAFPRVDALLVSCDDALGAVLEAHLHRYAVSSLVYSRRCTWDHQCNVAAALASHLQHLVRTCLHLAFYFGLLCLPNFVDATGSDENSRKPPSFDGTRLALTAFLTDLAIWIAWQQPDVLGIFEGTETRPEPPDAPVRPPAPSEGAGARERRLYDEAMELYQDQMDSHAVDLAEHATKLAAWNKNNTRLYGIIGMSMPRWLRTSLANSCAGDGVAALALLRRDYDANDVNDRATALQRLQASYISARNDVSEDDLRHQFDNMQVACNDIVRAGGHRPDDALLISMFENALPQSYTTIRQMARRQNHRTLNDYFQDIMAQTRAELSSRVPAVQAFQAAVNELPADQRPAALAALGLNRLPRPPGADGGGGRGRGGREGGRGRGRRGGRAQPGLFTNPCLRCGEDGHTRRECTRAVTRCPHCGGDHRGIYCPNGPGGPQREALSQGARNVADNDARRASGGDGGAANAHANNANTNANPNTNVDGNANQAPAAQQQAQQPPPQPQQPQQPQQPREIPPGFPDAAAAHAAAAAAAQAQLDPHAAAAAYATVLRNLGHANVAHAMSAAAATARPPVSPAPAASKLLNAMVDSMATFFVVGGVHLLSRVTDASPRFYVETADGDKPVTAIGDILIWLPFRDGSWQCYEVHNVLVLPNCSSNLYSTRYMRDHFGFKHDIDDCVIKTPSHGIIDITDTRGAFVIPIAFASAPPSHIHRGTRPPALLTYTGFVPSTFPAGVAGTTQALLYHRLAFPYEQQWRHVAEATTNHGLPPNATPSGTLPVSQAVMRGRARALPFYRKHPEDRTPPPPGAVFFMDMAGPLLPSYPHGYINYCGVICAGSLYGRMLPAHTMRKEIASGTLALMCADVGAKMGLTVPFKPVVVNSDNGSAFVSYHFREFLAERQIKQTFSPPYTPQLNGVVESMFGRTFATARVLLAAANLPPSLHPFAIQTARWIDNRLPKPDRANKSPFWILTHELPSLEYLYTFGCLCLATLPSALREGDKHFADRGAPGLYLGPSEEGSASLVYVFALRRVLPIAKLRVWEDEFPGLRGQHYRWFPDELAGPGGAATTDGFMRGPPNPPPNPPPVHPTAAPQFSQLPSVAMPGDPGQAFSPPSPSAPQQHRPRVEHPSTGTQPQVSAPSVQPRFGGPTHTQEGLAPARNLNFGNSGARSTTKLPKNDSGDPSDPSSRAFARSHAPRETRNPNPKYDETDTAGRAALNAAATIFCAVAALREHSDYADMVPQFAFANFAHSIDAAFISFDPSSNTDAIVHACEVAAHIFTATVVSTSDLGDIPIPRGYQRAISGPHSERWKEAIAKELAGLLALGTWELVPATSMPRGSNLMHCHYVLTVKRKRDGSVDKFKARLVADGNTQKYGVDFDRIFSTVVKASTIRLVLVVAAANDYNLSQIDIKQAYLQAEVTENLFMRVPPGIHPFDDQGRPLVCKLKRSIYGLKQAGKEWSTLFADFIVSWGFVRSTIDVCLFTYSSGSGLLWILVYVDDALIVDNDAALRARFVADLARRFPVDDRGELEWMLGVAVDRERVQRLLSLSQELYITDLTERYASYVSAGHTRRFDTPMEEGLHLSHDDSPAEGTAAAQQMSSRRADYMSIVGAFLWLANMSRHEISHVSSQLSRFVSNPGPTHFNAMLRVLIYLNGTKSRRLEFKPKAELPLHVLVDSSWDSKFSCSGAYFLFMGCPFHWFAKMQKSVTLSSAEAEYFGATLAAKEAIWLRELLTDLGLLVPGPTIMWCDSKSAVEMAFDPVAFKKTKHILRAAQFLRDQVARDVVTLRHARGAIMIADILTKGVARPLFLELLRLLDDYAALASADAIPEPNSSRSDAVSAPDTPAARRG